MTRLKRFEVSTNSNAGSAVGPHHLRSPFVVVVVVVAVAVAVGADVVAVVAAVGTVANVAVVAVAVPSCSTVPEDIPPSLPSSVGGHRAEAAAVVAAVAFVAFRRKVRMSLVDEAEHVLAVPDDEGP